MLNKHEIIGRVGKDPEARHLESGATVVTFSVATSEKYTNRQGEKVEETEWHNVVIWNKLAEIAEKYVKKGDLLYISGKSTTRSWEKDGVTRYTTELVAREMKMLGSKGSSSSEQSSAPPPPEPSQPDNQNEVDDLPF